jgi:hypothetical protein
MGKMHGRGDKCTAHDVYGYAILSFSLPPPVNEVQYLTYHVYVYRSIDMRERKKNRRYEEDREQKGRWIET